LAVDKLLTKKNLDYIQTFDEEWNCSKDYKGNVTYLFDNVNVVYAHADFDPDVLKPEDFETMNQWIDELDLGKHGDDPVTIFKTIAKIKKNPFKRIKDKELRYFARCSWLSLKRKGHIMLDSFYAQFYPKIEKVLAVQKSGQLKSDDGADIISGKIDMILKIKGYDKPIIFDLKTASQPYKQSQLDTSEQLSIYSAMEGDNYNTSLVGYVVLSKAINKEKIAHCKKCGNQKNGRHRTCNNLVNQIEPEQKPVRCDGEWDEKTVLAPVVQVMIEEKTPQQIEQVLASETQTIDAMKAGVVFKNTSKCENWYGSRCPFYNLCYKNDDSGLIKKD